MLVECESYTEWTSGKKHWFEVVVLADFNDAVKYAMLRHGLTGLQYRLVKPDGTLLAEVPEK